MQDDELRLYYTWRNGDKSACEKGAGRCTEYRSLISDRLRKQWLNQLPVVKARAISRLLDSADQDSSLLGLKLLQKCAQSLQVEGFSLGDIEYRDAGKPVWRDPKSGNNTTTDSRFDFNISHSADLVLVAAGRGLKIGLDAERIRPLKNLNFRSIMQAHELEAIKRQPDSFFRLWSIKEAVVKAADTSGLSRMREVVIGSVGSEEMPAYADFNGGRWYLKSLDIDRHYSVILATSAPLDKLVVRFMDIDTLMAGYA